LGSLKEGVLDGIVAKTIETAAIPIYRSRF